MNLYTTILFYGTPKEKALAQIKLKELTEKDLTLPKNGCSIHVKFGIRYKKRTNMICPSYGTDNSDDSGQCSNCGYKFRFGYANNDPKRMTFFNLLKSNTKKSKVISYLLVSRSLVIFVLIILSWFKSM